MRTNIQTDTLTCPSCIKKIEGGLNKMDGVEAAKVLFNSSKVKVQHDKAKVNADEIKDVIENLGYPVLDVKSR